MFTIFAASQTKRYLLASLVSSFFYGYTGAVLSEDIRLSIHNGLLLTRRNFSWSRCGAIAFHISNILIFHHMTKRMENYSSAKNSNATVTSAHETCIPTCLEEINQHVYGVHKAVIRIYPNRITAVFDIHGREVTAGGTSFAELFACINRQQENYWEWIFSERRRKKEEKQFNLLNQ
jgi:hypothetical protein